MAGPCWQDNRRLARTLLSAAVDVDFGTRRPRAATMTMSAS